MESRRKGWLYEEKSARGLKESLSDPGAPEYLGEAAVDIVAVHGLASTYETTWCAKLKDGSRYPWLTEKLGVDAPNARILGFEYGSEWYGEPSYTNLDECGMELLRCIVWDRQHVGRPEMCPTRRRRPIIFVAHSFGGLVVKQALVSAYRAWKQAGAGSAHELEPIRRAEAANYRDFLCSVAGIIFLGTPHRGSSFTTWANIKMTLGWMMGQQTYQELVKVLAANSEPLAELQRGFQEVCNDSNVMDANMVPRCHRETRALQIPPYMVVPTESAFLDQAVNGTMDANHMEMNKFLPGRDANYDKLLADVQQMMALGARSVLRRLEKWRYGSLIAEDDRNMVKHRLDPSGDPQTRHLRLKLASHQGAPYTCRWLEEHLLFRDWRSEVLDGKRNVLWIHGKPASGKSVLAAYTINMLSQQDKDDAAAVTVCDAPLGRHDCVSRIVKPTVLYYFCGVDRSHDQPRGSLGTLIHQLLSIHNTNEALFSAAHRWRESTSPDKVTAEKLVALFQELTGLINGQVFIIVDGLDETPHGTQCTRYLETIAAITRQKTRILITSQRQETLRKRLEGNDSVANFSIADCSQTDVHRYIRQNVEEMLTYRPEFAPKQNAIVTRLQEHVQGIFQLVNTTVDHLGTHISSADEVDDYLDDLPSSMQDVYDKTFERLRPSSQQAMARFRAALQVLAVSATPMTVLDLQLAIKVAGLIMNTSQEATLQQLWRLTWAEDETLQAEQDILQLLDSLVNVDDNHIVTLVHPSLRRSLFLHHGLLGQEEATQYMPNHAWYQFSEAHAHRLISDICIAVCADTTLVQANAFVQQRALVAYAWKFWAYHLRASGFTLDNSNPQNTRSRNAFDRMLRRVHQQSLSFLSALATFVTNPIDPVSGCYSLLEYRQSLQRAQVSTALGIDALCNSRQTFPIAVKLHEQKDRIPVDLHDIPRESRYQAAAKWARSKGSHFRHWLLNNQTQVSCVKLDSLMSATAIGNLYDNSAFPEPVKSLLNSSRALRHTALTFAVNPIHDALVQQAESPGFSPIHLLVYVAQLLEEAASFPYWEHMVEVLDPADAFICSGSDPQSSPPKFVLRSADWQSPMPEPEHWARQLRQLSDITPHRWLAARFGFDIFQTDTNSDGAWFKALVANPVSNLHIKEKLYMLSSDNQDQWPVFLNPAATLDLHAPISVHDAPVKEIVSAIPSILMFIYAKYVATLLELFAEVPRAGIVAHFIQLTTSKTELHDFASYVKTLAKSSLRRLCHVPIVLFLYFLRMQFFPSLGAHAMSHFFRDLVLSYHHPAAYLNLQSFHDAWFWFKYAMGVRLWNAAGRTFVVFGQTKGLGRLSNVQLVTDTVAGFYHLVTLERNLFGLSFSLAVLVASAKVIMYDWENLGAVGEFTFWYLTYNGLGVFNMIVGAVLDQNRATFWQGMAVVGSEIVLMVLLVVYQAEALRVATSILGWIFWPFTGPAMVAWKLGLYLYAPFLQLLGVLLFFVCVFLAVLAMEKAIWDPHDLTGSRNMVLKALKGVYVIRDEIKRLEVADFGRQGGALVGWDDDKNEGRKAEEIKDEDWDEWADWGAVDDDDGDEKGEYEAVESPTEVRILPRESNEQKVHLDGDKALHLFGQAAVKEFESAFSQVLQNLRHVRFDSSGGWSSGRSDNYDRRSILANDQWDQDQYRRRRRNGWSFGGLTPGAPLGSISYSWTKTTYGGYQKSMFWDVVFPIMFVMVWIFWAAMMVWMFCSWWTTPTVERV